MLSERSRSFLRELLLRYYSRLRELHITFLEQREFAIIPFENPDIMIRHKAFRDLPSLLNFIRRNLPLHVYYSSARYEYPEVRKMDQKGWLGADLIFDIDIDHIPTECKEIHDSWHCMDCGVQGRGLSPETCPRCGSRRIDRETWVCDRCLERAKEEVIKLVDDFLIGDFGFSKSEIKIVFSGHRGFHVHIENPEVLNLDQEARREIVEYIKGIGLRISPLEQLDMSYPGWKGRLARGLYFLITDFNEADLRAQGLRSKDIKYLAENRALLARALEKGPLKWGMLKISRRAKERIVEIVRNSQGVEIDERVTTDIKRLIRLPGSIHGKTGLKVVRVEYSNLEDFEPFQHAALNYEDTIKIRLLKEVPDLVLGGYQLKAAKGSEVVLPFAQGLYLIFKGVAEPARRG